MVIITAGLQRFMADYDEAVLDPCLYTDQHRTCEFSDLVPEDPDRVPGGFSVRILAAVPVVRDDPCVPF